MSFLVHFIETISMYNFLSFIAYINVACIFMDILALGSNWSFPLLKTKLAIIIDYVQN